MALRSMQIGRHRFRVAVLAVRLVAFMQPTAVAHADQLAPATAPRGAETAAARPSALLSVASAGGSGPGAGTNASSSRRSSSARLQLLERHRRWEPLLREAAIFYSLPVDFLRAIMRVESDLHPELVSSKGARGLMQLMPFHTKHCRMRDPFEPRENIFCAALLLRRLANRWNGDLVLTIASYNAGAGAVQRYHGVPPFRETQGYVTRVLTHYRVYRTGRFLRRR